ncbi:Uncharacterised protein [Bordetella pertussis]|nr:Uncharacterised protein [Bordetella pertussis]
MCWPAPVRARWYSAPSTALAARMPVTRSARAMGA